MVLHGHKKKVLKEVIRYFVETTGSKYDDFILILNRVAGQQDVDLTYPEWLARKSYDFLKSHDITIQDCIENKDVINSAINADSSRKEGEFYTPQLRCQDGQEYLKHMLGDLWGQAYVWDASCGAGNLMRTANYPTDKLFLSSLLKEDIEIIQATPEYQGVEAFQLDFLNELDWDRNNMRFSDKLPPRLRQILETNQPLVFFMNPPYKVMEANSSDMGGYMASHGMAKCALDIFHQFMYRLVLLKRTYNLTNVYLGIFGPVTMFHSTMIEPLYNEFKEEFKFVDGFCFDAGEFSGTSESVGWMVGYTTWRTRLAGEQDTSIVLEAKSLDASGNSVSVGKRLVTSVDININTWVQAEDIIRYDQYLPVISTFKTFTDQFIKVPENFLGYIMSSNYAIRATRRACVTSLPTPENIPITEENFWRCVASFTARRCYASKQNPYNNCQYYSMPDTTIEGYDQWLADALVVFLFDYSSHLSAYRDLVIGDQTFNLSNKLFPIDHKLLEDLVTDPVLLKDMQNFPPQNQFLLSVTEYLFGTHAFSEEGAALYHQGIKIIAQSLVGTLRSDYNYANWTQAWDAGLLQIRDVSGLVPKDDEELYSYLLSKLKHKLLEGVYKFGFLMDTAFAVEDDATFAVEDAAPFTIEEDEPFVIEDEEDVF